jgi:surface polysaccharide O-acyltransferase-like enzyme
MCYHTFQLSEMSKKEHKSYFFWADLMRIIAISFVVLIHSFRLSYPSSFSDYLSLCLFVIAKAGVPLFIMLSGALLISKQESIKLFFRKRIKRILIPWFFWTVVITLIGRWMYIHSPIDVVTQLKITFLGDFTFLPMLFCLYLFIPSFRILVKHGSIDHFRYLVLIWFVGVCLLPYLRNTLAFPLSVDNGLVSQTARYSGYLLLGWLLANLNLSKKVINKLLMIGLFITAITVWIVIRNGQLDLIFLSYFSPFIVGMSTIVFLILLSIASSLSLTQTTINIVKQFSQASFGVFLIHTTVIYFVNKLEPWTFSNELAVNVTRWLITLLISFGLIIFLRKINFLNNLVS